MSGTFVFSRSERSSVWEAKPAITLNVKTVANIFTWQLRCVADGFCESSAQALNSVMTGTSGLNSRLLTQGESESEEQPLLGTDREWLTSKPHSVTFLGKVVAYREKQPWGEKQSARDWQNEWQRIILIEMSHADVQTILSSHGSLPLSNL